ncbi:uncharacterized protein LOC134230546, partial [Saccostrea cucullata]|uniref:uncharacterized protein LOC134230546 n=1 Tax=Saccostrea cuccullata TaxID=36930 RepID=UPI002ED274D9
MFSENEDDTWERKLHTRIENVGTTMWFSFPEFNEERQQIEPKCLDAHHLLVNLRCKVCKDGLLGVRKEAWHRVAENNNSIISNAIVVDLVDKQNNAFAKRTFSKAVEDEMRNLAFSTEADFCSLIRRWYESEDSGGISAVERIQRKLDLKSFLLRDVDFGVFPPPGMYVKGFPKVMYEGFLQRIDTSIQLYSIVKGQSYNQRSLSSLVNETFFGELSELEPTKLGCPKAVSVPRLMANVTEMQHYRCDPSDRAFHICTTRKSVYPNEKLMEPLYHTFEQNEVQEICYLRPVSLISPRNHAFDAPELFGKRQLKSKRSDISQPSGVSRGCLP